jgi:hypothetical protein
MKKWTLGGVGKTKPKQTQFKANSNPIQTQNEPNTNPKQTQNEPNTNPIKPKQSQFQKRYLLVKRMIDNYLLVALFSLTSCPAGRYNGFFSKISFFPETIERV